MEKAIGGCAGTSAQLGDLQRLCLWLECSLMYHDISNTACVACGSLREHSHTRPRRSSTRHVGIGPYALVQLSCVFETTWEYAISKMRRWSRKNYLGVSNPARHGQGMQWLLVSAELVTPHRKVE